MTNEAIVELSKLRNGQSGRVVNITGGIGIISKLEALGIRKGIIVTKKSALIARGPVIVLAGGTEIAMGYGMASKIFVEVNKA